MHTVLYELEM